MPVTGLRGRQILDGDVLRNDLNITKSGSAVIRRIIAGTNITISSTGADTGTGDVTINASGGTGTVTSVGLSLPNIFSISGSPVTSSGTLTGTFVSQTANTIFAAPNGSNGTPTFRALVAADIPELTLEKLPDAWVKRAVRVATTANITLSGTQTIDGIAVVAGDRVLVKNQTTTSQNGIYVASATAWSRSADADTSSEIAGGMVAVDLGTANGGTTWDTDFKSSDTIGTTAMTWFRVIDTGYGAALTKTDDTNVTLTLGGSPTTALIQATSLTLGWTGQLAVSRGGTGASSLTGVLIGNGTSAVTDVAGSASQLLRRNAGNTAYEFFTHTFASTTGATFTGNILFANATSPFSNYIQFGDNTGWVFRFMTNVSGTPTERFRFVDNGNFQATGQIITTRANSTADGGGQIFLNGTGGNRIEWVAAGVAAPSYTTRSVGAKLVLYPSVNASQVDYGFGIESDTLWASVAVTGGSFKWYGGTQLNMHLSGQNLLVGSGVGVGAGRLTVGAAVGGTSLYLTDATNSTLYITHSAGGRTTFYNGTATAWLQEVGTAVTIGNSTSAPSKLYLFNTNDGIPDYQITHQSSGATLNTSSPIIITNLYNSGSNGHNLYVTSSSAAGVWEYNITKTWGGIFTLGSSTNGTSLVRQFYLYDSGQIRLANYTTTSSFSGTAVGVLAFTSDGSIITIPTPGGGSGLTGSGTTNYIPKFTGSTSLGNSVIYESSSNISIGTTTVDAKLRVSGTTNGTQAIFGTVDGRGLVISTALVAGTNEGGSILNARSSVGSGALIIQTDGTEQARFAGNGDIGFGTNSPTSFGVNYRTLDLRGYGSGSVLQFTTSDGTGRGYVYGSTAETAVNAPTQFRVYVGANSIVTSSSTLFNVEQTLRASKAGSQFQITGGATESGVFQGASSNVLFIGDWATATKGMSINVSTGAFRLLNYTTTSSFTGTAVGVLAFDASGNILTIATPGGGSSQWTTNGIHIYYNTGNVGIGATTPDVPLHILKASGTAAVMRFEQTGQRNFYIGVPASQTYFDIYDSTAVASRLKILSTGQLALPAYLSPSTFNSTDAVGGLYFDSTGNVITGVPPIYRITFTAAGNFTLTNQASALQFFNNQSGYITRADLSGYKRVRLHVQKGGTAGATNSKIILRYRTAYSNTTTDYIDIGTSEVSVAINTTNTHLTTSWINLAALAKGDVFVALMMSGGDGSADPIVGHISAEFDF